MLCDRATPCSACAKTETQCSFTRVQAQQSISTSRTKSQYPDISQAETGGSAYERGLENATDPIQVHEPGCAPVSTRVPFLLSYTAAENGKDFAHALETFKEATHNASPNEKSNPADVGSFPTLLPLFATQMFDFDLSPAPPHSPVLAPQAQDFLDVSYNGIEPRIAEISTFLESLCEAASSTSPGAMEMLQTPADLAICIDSFFQNAYKHVPIVHRPTFAIESVELPLLLAIVVVGALWSYPRDTYFMVSDIVELAEKCVFESEVFVQLREFGPKSCPISLPRTLALLQAATVLMAISFSLPVYELRRRFREHRYPDLVALVRQLQGDLVKSGMGTTMHASQNFDWKRYLTIETSNR